MKSLLLLMQCLSPVSKILAEEEDSVLFDQFRALVCDPWKRIFRPKESAIRDLADLRQLTRHPNGYLRERAVEDLAMRQDTLGLHELLTCANDWVPQIHHAATAAVQALIRPENAAAFIAHLPQIRHLLDCERYDHTALVGQISQFLTSPAHLPALHQAVHCANRDVAKAVLYTLIDQDQLTDEATLLWVLKNRDARLRVIAVNRWLEDDKPLSENVAVRLLRDRWSRIRRDTLFHLDRHQQPLPESLHTALLLDKNALIQQRASLMLADAIKAIPFWLQVVTTPIWSTTERRRALYGLKEARYHALHSLALWGYEHSDPGIRLVSLQILLMQEGDETKAYALSALAVPALPFAIAAMKQLKLAPQCFSVDDVEWLFINAPSAKHTFLYWRLLHQLNKWDWLILLLRHSPSLAASQREKELAVWKGKYNRSGIYPTANQHETLEILLQRDPGMRDALRPWLG